jgi:hypothetical protein
MIRRYFPTKKQEKSITRNSYYPDYIVYSLERKGIYEPFRFYEEKGWKMRGYSKEENKFYFNDIPKENKISALGEMSKLMFGLNRKGRQ